MSAGPLVSWVEFNNSIGALQSQLTALQQQVGSSSSTTTGTGLAVPVAPWPTSIENEKAKLVASFEYAYPSGSQGITNKLEEYTQTGPGGSVITVVRNYEGQNSLDNAQSIAGQSVLTYTPRLNYNSLYGCSQLIVEFDPGRTKNPSTVPALPRKLSDYLITFPTGGPFGLPSIPNAAQIIANGLETPKTHQAYTTFRMYAPLTSTGQAQTWGAAGVTQCVFVIYDNNIDSQHPNGQKYRIAITLDSTDLSQTDPASPTVANRGYVDGTLHKETPGELYFWAENIAWAGDVQSIAQASPFVSYGAGGYNTTIQNLTNVALILDNNNAPSDTSGGTLYLQYTQPTPPVALKNVSVYTSVNTGSGFGAFKEAVDRFSLRDDTLQTAGTAYTVTNGNAPTLRDNFKLKPSSTMQLKLVLKAIGDVIYTIGGSDPIFTFTIGADGHVINDTGPPVINASPVFRFHPGYGLHYGNMVVASQFNSPADPCKYVEVFNPVTSQYGDLITYMSTGGATIQLVSGTSVSSPATRLPIGNKAHDTIPISKQHLRQMFGYNATTNPNVVIQGLWYAQNEYAVLQGLPPTASPATPQLALSTMLDILTSGGAAAVIGQGTTLISSSNELSNGNFSLLRSGGSGARAWVTGSGIGGTGGPIQSTGSAGILLDAAHNRLIWSSSSSSWGQRLGDPFNGTGSSAGVFGVNIKPGDFHTVGLILAAQSSSFTDQLLFFLLSPAGTVVTVSFVVSLTPTPTLYQFTYQIPTAANFGPAGGQAIWWVMEDQGGAISSNPVYVYQAQQNTGQSLTAYTAMPQNETGASGTVFYDAAPVNTGASGAINYSPTGPTLPSGATQGGGSGPGFGVPTLFS